MADQTFEDPACPQYCRNVNPSLGIEIRVCNLFNQSFYCSEYTGQSCNESASVFTMTDANTFLFNNTADAVVTLSPYDVLNASTSSSRTLPTEACGSARGAAGTTMSSAIRYTVGDMAGVGAGIGIPLLLALLATGYIILRQRRNLKGSEVKQQHSTLGYFQSAEYADRPEPRAEMDYRHQVNELGADPKRQELGTSR